MAETRAQPVSRMRAAPPKFSDQELYFLAEKFGMPYFLIDEATMRRNAMEIEQAFQDFKGPLRVAYSMMRASASGLFVKSPTDSLGRGGDGS